LETGELFEVKIMAQTLWTLPVPTNALLGGGVAFKKLLGRTCALLCEYEDDNDNVVYLKLLFEGVEAFRCTYMTACTLYMIETAYDEVADLGSTQWLNDVKVQSAKHYEKYYGQAIELRHLMIYFGDGPCYEFICQSFRIEESMGQPASC
jgi:hypothetical protein